MISLDCSGGGFKWKALSDLWKISYFAFPCFKACGFHSQDHRASHTSRKPRDEEENQGQECQLRLVRPRDVIPELPLRALRMSSLPRGHRRQVRPQQRMSAVRQTAQGPDACTPALTSWGRAQSCGAVS